MKDLPIVCSLTEPELRARREEISRVLITHVREKRELETGWGFRFEANDAVIDELLRLIQLERKCCPFLQFNLVLEANAGPVWLEITGDQAKDFLKMELGL